ncbi:MAG: squalene--hopene cyclase [Nitrosomonadaceae bacterium]|nr:squalene--hopene cyclase [Nitrosomonadaceae bacterium]|tara:strand:- start:1688 stop:3634 length:1947 start_codon:yes stop_codon:yes gene_type:complete
MTETDNALTNLSQEDISSKSDTRKLVKALASARKALLALQKKDGHWCFPLEADCTIPAEYILMMHFMDDIDTDLEIKIARFIRTKQDKEHGGWPLYYGGHFDISCTVKAYYALKLAGDSQDAPHMVAARTAILSNGGASKTNVFTRILLAMYEQLPWRGVPFMPVEIILLPKWFPFHLSKIAYWSRTVTVPLTILCSLRAKAANPHKINIRELFTIDPKKERDYFPVRTPLNRLFLFIERTASVFEPFIPNILRRVALRRAERWIIERLNGECGLGAIFPAMVNANEALSLLGYPYEHPYRDQCRKALLGLLIIDDEQAWCQPCTSPVWDTALASLALQEDSGADQKYVRKALNWLAPLQILDAPADWREENIKLAGGGWAFQYANPHYPDLDDTAAIAWAMYQADSNIYNKNLSRAAFWLSGMQSKNGGFGAFDVDNTYYYLNEIPFADHGALLDPPTSDVSARCTGFLALYGKSEQQISIKKGLDYLFNEQEKNGAWFGRWGSNYIYGTWSVLEALRLAKIDTSHTSIIRAVGWLKSVQREDGGWGENNDTYFAPKLAGRFRISTSFQTAWALLGLMAAGEAHSEEVNRGIKYLLNQQDSSGLWNDPWFTAPGFPRVFYLKYHGYTKYFPLWALARYQKITQQDNI